MREQWITNQAYSGAQQDWVSVAQYLREPSSYKGEFWLCGELKPGQDFCLVGFDKSLSVSQDLQFNGHSVLELCRPGDKLGLWISGQQGESLIVQKLQLLAPCLKAKELGVSPQQVNQWSDFLQQVREFFLSNNFREQQTPYLVSCPGLEPSLEPFETQWDFGSQKQKYFLPTSPELHLKKLLCCGHNEIFEIKTCFRNEEYGDHHQPEFTMLEWYRAYKPLQAIKEDLQQLLVHLSRQELKFSSRSIAELFHTYLDFELSPATKKAELQSLALRNKLCISQEFSWDDLFHLLFVEKIEAHLAADGPEFIFDFPASQAALARINQRGWADRFELYWRGMEIANAFDELNDPQIQRQRFEKDIEQRRIENKKALIIDEEFMEFLESGMPPSAGIAVGLERLFMACTGKASIDSVKPFVHKGL